MSEYLDRVDKPLAECQRNHAQSKVAHGGLRVQEGVQHMLQVDLNDGAAHTR